MAVHPTREPRRFACLVVLALLVTYAVGWVTIAASRESPPATSDLGVAIVPLNVAGIRVHAPPTPKPLPGFRLPHVAITRTRWPRGFAAVIRVDRQLPRARIQGQSWDFRLGHILQRDAAERRLPGGDYCYSARWILRRGEGIPITRPGGKIRMRMTYEHWGRVLGRGSAILGSSPRDPDAHQRWVETLGRGFGC